MADESESSDLETSTDAMVDEWRDMASDPETRGTMLVGAGPNLGAFATAETDGMRETYVTLCACSLLQFATEEGIDETEFIRDVVNEYNERKKAAGAAHGTVE